MKLTTIALSLILASGVATAALEDASASPRGLALSPHGVVRSSSLPACAVEDASSGPLPCTWNIGAGTEPGDGLGYVVHRDASFRYLWNSSPVWNHAHRSWDGVCWVSDASPRLRHCPDGTVR